MTQEVTHSSGRRALAVGLAVLAASAFALSACTGMTPQQEARFESGPLFWHEEPQED